MRLVLTATILLLGTLFFAQHARSMNIVTPRDSFLHSIQEARGQPTHTFWFYIAGIISGTNATSLILTGHPAICNAHPFEQHDKTEEVLMRWLLIHDLMDNPDIVLEVAIPLAFREAYPCSTLQAQRQSSSHGARLAPARHLLPVGRGRTSA
jgi:hypothetical protein